MCALVVTNLNADFNVLKFSKAPRCVHKGQLANIIMHPTMAGAYVGSMYAGLYGAYGNANALDSAPCFALRAIIYYRFGEL